MWEYSMGKVVQGWAGAFGFLVKSKVIWITAIYRFKMGKDTHFIEFWRGFLIDLLQHNGFILWLYNYGIREP